MQVTILSGYPNFNYAQRAIELGVVSYVLKPSRFQLLEEALAKMTENLHELQQSQTVPPALQGAFCNEVNEAETQTGTEKAQNFIVKNALDYIRTHYAERLALADVADAVYVSQWHLSKLISRYTQQSFF